LGGRKGIRPVKKWVMDGGGHGLVQMEWRPRMVGVFASVSLPLHHKVQKFSSGTADPGGPGKRAVKRLWCGTVSQLLCRILRIKKINHFSRNKFIWLE